MPRTLALIPARGGSKGLPRKNIALLLGKPLIAWTIEAARACALIDRVVVTTEAEEIAAVAREWGAEAPFMRPAELAADDVPGIHALVHAVEWLQEHQDYHADYVMSLVATSPLRTAEDIGAAIRLAEAHHADVVSSVHPAQEHPYWAQRITPDGWLVPFLDIQPASTQRQKLPPVYALNGAIWLARTEVLMQHLGVSERTYGYVIPAERALDIDTAWHLYLAELILKDQQKAAKGL